MENMENKKTIKISLITFLVIILIIFILIAIFLFFNVYKLNKNNPIENNNLVDEDSTNISSTNNTNDLSSNSIDLFTEENIKTCLSNYLELYSHANCDNLLEDLTKMEVLNYDPSKDTISDTGTVTTHILFADYKKAMLNYVSEKEFQKNWYQSLYYSENSNGYLTKLQGGGGLCTYTIENINKVNNLTYFAIVEDDISTKQEENFTFTVTNYNNKCVIDSIIAENSNETNNINNTDNIDSIAKNLFEKGSLKIRETLYTDYYEYPSFSPLEKKRNKWYKISKERCVIFRYQKILF